MLDIVKLEQYILYQHVMCYGIYYIKGNVTVYTILKIMCYTVYTIPKVMCYGIYYIKDNVTVYTIPKVM